MTEFQPQTVKVLDKGFVTLADCMHTNPRQKIVDAARTSFDGSNRGMDERDEKLLVYLREHGHLATFRHSYTTFIIRAPLFVFNQWHKYQVGCEWSVEIENWNELSGRYVEFKPEFYTPSEWRLQSKSNKQGSDGAAAESASADLDIAYRGHLTRALSLYNEMLQDGVAKEMARMVLPPSIYSTAMWTCSTQSLGHFLRERLAGHAQWETRQYAQAIEVLALPLFDGKAPW
jgi:thymidylate synthase (FAD)